MRFGEILRPHHLSREFGNLSNETGTRDSFRLKRLYQKARKTGTCLRSQKSSQRDPLSSGREGHVGTRFMEEH